MPDHPLTLSGGAYLTVAKEARGELTVQKSRFAACVAPSSDEETALRHVSAVREAFRGADHYCYAYIIGMNAGVMRHQDDREPSGTAGLPILETVRGRGLVNVCAVVARYFGGILLGRGGLARAYGKACAAAVDAAQLVRMAPSVRVSAAFPYPFWDKARHRLRDLQVSLEELSFGSRVNAVLVIPEKLLKPVLEALKEASDGQVAAEEMERFDHPWPL